MTSALSRSEKDRRLIRDLAGQVAEIIMKDISTCRRDPRRLWEWCTLAMEVAEAYA